MYHTHTLLTILLTEDQITVSVTNGSRLQFNAHILPENWKGASGSSTSETW